MNITRLTSINNPYFNKAFALYEKSFPKEERRDKDKQIEILKNKNYHYDILTDNNKFIGIALFWETESFIFFEHLCIEEEHRNKKYGTKAFEHLINKGKNIILEVEEPFDDISDRRVKLYERLGFVINDYEYYQPPYRKTDQPTKLLIMSLNKKLTEKEFQEFLTYTKEIVYKL